jgi:hypothetical protein
MSCVLVLLRAIVVMVVIVVWGVPLSSFYIQGGRITRKVPWSVSIEILIGLYLLSFLIIRIGLIRVGLYLWELHCCRLVVMWAYADPFMGLLSHHGHIARVCILNSSPQVFFDSVDAEPTGSSLHKQS